MKPFYRIALSAALLLVASSCFRQEAQTAEYFVPKMSTPEAATYLQNRIKRIPGIIDISSNLKAHTLTVRYESDIIRIMNIEETIALAGYAVNNRPQHSKN